MTMQINRLLIKDFSDNPGLRYVYQSDYSGEEYYNQILQPTFHQTIDDNAILEINLDGVRGYASSFLDEIFGRLVLEFGVKCVKDRVKIISMEEPHWIDMIEKQTYIKWSDSVIPSYSGIPFEKNIFNGNSEYILKYFAPETFDLTFCSPPYYNTKEYSQYDSYDEYLSKMVKIFDSVHRVTKEGKFLVINVSPVIEPRLSRQHQSKRYPIPFDLTHLLTKNKKWDFIEDIIWEKPESSVKNRIGQFLQHRKPMSYKPNIVHEYVLVFRKHTDKLIDWNLKQYSNDIINHSKIKDGYEKTSIWKIHPKSSKHHPAIFPEELAEKVIKYYSMVDDTVLDPFSGIGTTCKVAKRLNRNYIGIELHKEYYNYSLQNIN